MTPSLVVGPLLRYTGDTDATVWVETDAACTVEVLGCRDQTFCVHGHHYALVHVTGLAPGSTTPYDVRLDGEPVWPQADSGFPPSVIRTSGGGEPTVIAFGSCRVAAPNEPPYSLSKDDDPRGREADALRALAMRMASDADEPWPHLLLLLGDQVYADELSPGVCDEIRTRRDVSVPPGEEVADFEEYTLLYRESWCEPHTRWLLSTVPSAMIFDDHDVIDDWNTSAVWVRRMRATGWWDDRIVGGMMTYWIYQHIGNLAPERLADNEQWRQLRADGADATRVLREFAFAADREVEGTRWSYSREVAGARVIIVDTRAGRVLEPGARSMLDEGEFAWLEERVKGDAEHVLIACSLPVLLPAALHYLEAWNEAVCDGAWGHWAARAAERVREALDLEHWAAFGASLERLMRIVRDAGRGAGAPASITLLSGDVHHASLAEVRFRDDGVRSRVWQAVCSPFRNPLDDHERRAIRVALTWPAALFARALARTAGVRRPPVRWRFSDEGPWFDNQVATITLEGRSARLAIEKTVPDGDDLALERVFAYKLA